MTNPRTWQCAGAREIVNLSWTDGSPVYRIGPTAQYVRLPDTAWWWSW